jgi:hypothetical protein
MVSLITLLVESSIRLQGHVRPADRATTFLSTGFIYSTWISTSTTPQTIYLLCNLNTPTSLAFQQNPGPSSTLSQCWFQWIPTPEAAPLHPLGQSFALLNNRLTIPISCLPQNFSRGWTYSSKRFVLLLTSFNLSQVVCFSNLSPFISSIVSSILHHLSKPAQLPTSSGSWRNLQPHYNPSISLLQRIFC